MNDILLVAAAIAIALLLTASVLMLVWVVRLTRPRKRLGGPFATTSRAIERETLKVLDALDASTHVSRIHASVDPIWRVPSHWLLAETSDEGVGLLCAIAARPGPARLRIKKAVYDRVRKADVRLEETMRECLERRPSKVAVERWSDKKIVLLDGREWLRLEAARENLVRIE